MLLLVGREHTGSCPTAQHVKGEILDRKKESSLHISHAITPGAYNMQKSTLTWRDETDRA